jgi:uncharacterized repeat protein (TIGR03803 family)
MAASIFDIRLRVRTAAVGLVMAFASCLAVSTADAQTLTVLHSFTGGVDGREPIAGVARDEAGNLYGTADFGGANNLGVVYKLAHKGSGWELSTLYSFAHGDGGYGPVGGVAIGSDGNLYGTASQGGQYGKGTVYKLSPPPSLCRSVSCSWTETVLHQFTGFADGAYPESTPIFDSAGNLYGTADGGGTANHGVVFELINSGSGWNERVLCTFAGSPDGSIPFSSVTFDQNGNLYGTTVEGGAGYGTVYQLLPSGSGWTKKILYVFQGGNDGSAPYAGITPDPDGNLYGATFYAGVNFGGTIYELTPSDGNWNFSVIYSPEDEEGGPEGTLVRGSNGNLYGTIFSGTGQGCSGYGCGSIYQLTPSHGGWVYSSLVSFNGDGGGGNPEGALIFDPAGNLYGTTSGSLAGYGSVYEVTP